MKFLKLSTILIVAITIICSSCKNKTEVTSGAEELPVGMSAFVIEREIPNAGAFTPQQLKEIAEKSCSVLKEMGSGIKWVHSYVTANKIYCVYNATDPAVVREHALKGGFPANSISRVRTVISPETAGK